MDKINLKAPAKINLFLRVLDRRPDSFHNIDSLIQAVSLYDDITLEVSDDIELECTGLDDVSIEDNLAYKAARLIADMAYFPGVRITLNKNIPTGSGLGGGSSDAAFVIRGLIKLFDLQPDRTELVKKAASLGADIPFFLGHGQSRIGGIGDILEDYFLPLNYEILIIKPSFSIKTSWAYQTLNLSRQGKFSLTKEKDICFLQKRLSDSGFVRAAKHFTNDFEEVVFSWHHELFQVKQTLLQEGAFYAGMSGSGSAIFGLFPPNNNFEKTLRRFTDDKMTVFACRPVLLSTIE